MGIMDNSDMAFEPFFDTCVIATNKRGETQTMAVSIFEDGEGEPISDDMAMDTSKKSISLLARSSDWWFVKNLDRGDTITIGEEKYSISEVRHDFAMGMVVKARQM